MEVPVKNINPIKHLEQFAILKAKGAELLVPEQLALLHPPNDFFVLNGEDLPATLLTVAQLDEGLQEWEKLGEVGVAGVNGFVHKFEAEFLAQNYPVFFFGEHGLLGVQVAHRAEGRRPQLDYVLQLLLNSLLKILELGSARIHLQEVVRGLHALEVVRVPQPPRLGSGPLQYFPQRLVESHYHLKILLDFQINFVVPLQKILFGEFQVAAAGSVIADRELVLPYNPPPRQAQILHKFGIAAQIGGTTMGQ